MPAILIRKFSRSISPPWELASELRKRDPVLFTSMWDEWTSDHDLIMNANFEDHTFAKPLICFHENRCPKCMARSAP